MNKITDEILKLPEFDMLRNAVKNKETPVSVYGVSYIHKAHIISALKSMGKPCFIVTANQTIAQKLACDIQEFSQSECVILPTRDLMFHNIDNSSKQWEHMRINALNELGKGVKTVIAPIEAAIMLTLPKSAMERMSIKIIFNKNYDIKKLVDELVSIGYVRAMQVEGKGQFSFRGGILDIFASNYDAPVRIEFFGDEIDTMATFDIETQRRRTAVDSFVCLPASESLPNVFEGGVPALIKRIRCMTKGAKHTQEFLKTIETDIERLQNDIAFPAIDRYLPVIYNEMTTAFDYINNEFFLFIDDLPQIRETIENFNRHICEDILSLIDRGLLCSAQNKFCLDYHDFCNIALRKKSIILDSFLTSNTSMPPRKIVDICAKQLPLYGGNVQSIISDIDHYKKNKYRIVVLCSSESRKKNMSNILEDNGIKCRITDDFLSDGIVSIMCGNISASFEYPDIKLAVFSEGQMLARRIKSKASSDKKGRQYVKSFTDLTVGDIVVHEHHGICRFSGIEKMAVDSATRDYIKLSFAGTDCLYVPAIALHLISKYIGTNGQDSPVKMNKLSGSSWQAAKLRAKASAKNLAKGLIELYAKRSSLEGIAFCEDDAIQKEFEGYFPYKETEDQLKCIDEIKRDMIVCRPMDRLLCADVGFGKTEVALRAVMKCILSNKQAAILVPTTVLARQHYLTCVARFDKYPVKIEMLSRFKTPKEEKLVKSCLKEGKIDLIIGTHKLLAKTIQFKDLGLLIVDEEQRFGVSHKERLKEMSKSVDVLTLSATPIPRTLNMALSGIRDMSIIEEPPADRHPVQTYVLEYDFNIICDALRREFHRGGQSYYVHNRIDSIDSVAANIQKEIEDVIIAVAHGKMGQKELSDTMSKMSEGEIDILVCTTIIETGIDIPNVNTLIIEDSDNMGLSQLHQIRGRVGRSSRHAFAYFTYRRGKVLNEIAAKRLMAIREFAQFGSGFKIAMRDLEIRGAGNVLGAEQSGHMMNVGYDLYLKILEQAVLEEKGENTVRVVDCIADVTIDANIPDYYVEDSGQRIDLYRRIAMIKTEEEKTDIIDEIIDRFSDMPQSVFALCEIALIRAKASGLGIEEIIQKDNQLIFKYAEAPMENAVLLCSKFKGRMLLNAGDKPYVSLKLKESDSDNILGVINEVLLHYKSIVKNKNVSD